MNGFVGAGALSERLEVLELRETSSGVWEWVPVRRAWAQVAQTAKTNLFSKVGVGARDAAVVLRRQPLTLHQALRWKGKHLFLTAITCRDRNHMDVAAALVDTVEVLCQRYTTVLGPDNRPEKQALPELVFPGVVTERYVRYAPEETYAKAKCGLVLVTPKVIQLKEGDLVTLRTGPVAAQYNVQTRHVLDEYKNEYEIAWSKDI